MTAGAVAAVLGLAACEPASPLPREEIAPGVWYESFDYEDDRHGTARVHLVTADLDRARAGLVHEPTVTSIADVTSLAGDFGAVAAINGDYFNDRGSHLTNAPVGPVITEGHHLKAAVPGRQRYGPSPPEGSDDNRDVFGLTADGRPVITSLRLEGTVETAAGSFPVDGLNQYAIPVDGIGVFTPNWGEASRQRAVCGREDESRDEDDCDRPVHEVTVAGGVVTEVADAPGDGPVGTGETVLLGRDAGADRLARLSPGDRVEVDYRLVSPDGVEPVHAIGGIPLAVDGQALTGLEDEDTRARTAVGYSGDGGTLYLAVTEENTTSLAMMARIMTSDRVGAAHVFGFDGGSSSAMATLDGAGEMVERYTAPGHGGVPNGLAVFSEGSTLGPAEDVEDPAGA